MTLERWIALVILIICLIYGYTAFFTMDDLLPPFMQRNPVWPSTFPKILSISGAVLSTIILLGLEKTASAETSGNSSELDYRQLFSYKIGQACLLLALMVAYALLLRPAGFLLATCSFLLIGPLILGERRILLTLSVALIATGIVWYLVQQVLGIFLRPLPFFL